MLLVFTELKEKIEVYKTDTIYNYNLNGMIILVAVKVKGLLQQW